jgi:Ion channel
MMSNLLIGFGMLLLCLLIEATFVTFCLRGYARFTVKQHGDITRFEHVVMLSVVMSLMLLGNLAQIAIWAGLFMVLGEFGDFATALYHSGVNYGGLGYGDIVMSEDRRLLGPLETANGILMFGVSTAFMTAAVIEVIKQQRR